MDNKERVRDQLHEIQGRYLDTTARLLVILIEQMAELNENLENITFAIHPHY